MQTVLFHSTIYGPIRSRRLGMSLGINLMPNDGKICSFDCLYCEAGFNAQGPGKDGVPTREAVKKQLRRKFEEMKREGQTLDVITFSGNGEPTLHPEFDKIVGDVLRLRTEYFPNAKVSVLSNSTMAGKPSVVKALLKVDNNILKLDSAFPQTFRVINRPVSPNCLPEGVIADLKRFEGQCVVQTIMLRGEYEGQHFDNTTDKELDALLSAYLEIKPREVMLYSIDRKTPAENLEKVSKEELERIAQRFRDAGIKVQVNA
ncbi:MAG: radical SAM protein [Muribaculaceae bacterium]|nr:radical SAM protein [Muribaculaceae bacterium]